MKDLYIPLLWELAFIISLILMPKNTYQLEVYFIFYLGLLVYFYYFHKQFSFRKFFRNIKRIRKFWLIVVLAILGMVLADYIKDTAIPQLFNYVATTLRTTHPDSEFAKNFARMLTRSLIHNGTVTFRYDNDVWGTLFEAFVMILMKPVAEELFFRKGLIKYGSRKKVFLYAVISLILCALTRAHAPLGIAEYMLMALPLTIAYVSTRNIYVPIMAHVLFEFIDKVPVVVYELARIYYR